MTTKFYLTSGHSSKRELKDFDKEALGTTENKRVAILNFTSNDAFKRGEKSGFLTAYFQNLGAKKVTALGPEDSRDRTTGALYLADLLYLPGGDTKTFLRFIQEKDLTGEIANFEGPILGNSAGAYALTPEYLRIGRGEPEIVPATGILPIHLKCHYKPEFDEDLTRLSENKEIWALKDSSMIIYESLRTKRGVTEAKGNVWRFLKSKKEKIN